ncbi:hypothetical protein VNO78_07401 [Psophocarpus tetragonolobus]|uniref:non-specific serine/threonine protein kinase n=1 Tax=Psophocarpus tetragonolobus TaxID=3891 RepID=A0AAN9T334_PSOTE
MSCTRVNSSNNIENHVGKVNQDTSDASIIDDTTSGSRQVHQVSKNDAKETIRKQTSKPHKLENPINTSDFSTSQHLSQSTRMDKSSNPSATSSRVIGQVLKNDAKETSKQTSTLHRLENPITNTSDFSTSQHLSQSTTMDKSSNPSTTSSRVIDQIFKNDAKETSKQTSKPYKLENPTTNTSDFSTSQHPSQSTIMDKSSNPSTISSRVIDQVSKTYGKETSKQISKPYRIEKSITNTSDFSSSQHLSQSTRIDKCSNPSTTSSRLIDQVSKNYAKETSKQTSKPYRLENHTTSTSDFFTSQHLSQSTRMDKSSNPSTTSSKVIDQVSKNDAYETSKQTFKPHKLENPITNAFDFSPSQHLSQSTRMDNRSNPSTTSSRVIDQVSKNDAKETSKQTSKPHRLENPVTNTSDFSTSQHLSQSTRMDKISNTSSTSSRVINQVSKNDAKETTKQTSKPGLENPITNTFDFSTSQHLSQNTRMDKGSKSSTTSSRVIDQVFKNDAKETNKQMSEPHRLENPITNTSNFYTSPHPNQSTRIDKSSNPSTTSSGLLTKSTREFRIPTETTHQGQRNSSRSRSNSLESTNCTHIKPHTGGDVRWDAINIVSRGNGLTLSHFRLLKRVGYGDIGSVYLVELKGSKAFFAMKVMDKASLANRNKLLRAQTEREILGLLDHPFLPNLYSYFETDKYYCLVMEFCSSGSLHSLRLKQPDKHFTEEATRFYCSEILLALEYLHMLGIVYRDLKPENVLVRDEGHIMLSDFDLSLRCSVNPTLVKSSSAHTSSNGPSGGLLEDEPVELGCIQPSSFFPRILPSKKNNKSKSDFGPIVGGCLPELMAEPTNVRSMSFVGTHEYLAPEIVRGEGHGSAVDWWTFGIFLYELLHGTTPFKGAGNKATLFNVVGQPLRFPEKPRVSNVARDLIKGLLVKEPQKRFAYKRGATEIKQHPFFTGVNWALIRSTTPPVIPEPFDFSKYASKANAPPPDKKIADIVASDKSRCIKPSSSYENFEYF